MLSLLNGLQVKQVVQVNSEYAFVTIFCKYAVISFQSCLQHGSALKKDISTGVFMVLEYLRNVGLESDDL